MKYTVGDEMEIEFIELAKRVLEHKNISIKLDREDSEEMYSTIISISEEIPSLILNVEINKMDKDCLEFLYENTILAYIGFKEPENIETLWIKKNSFDVLNNIKNAIILLSESGYPGCKNCLGPKYDYVWDERSYRDKIVERS
jgi:hypothetical protein|tara:strand:+ start:182 stop:610 length:429 start_codon:yes stop_codon:yes gene_type:complete